MRVFTPKNCGDFMKKYILILLCIAVLASLCSCGTTAQTPETTAPPSSAAVSQEIVSVDINGDFIGDAEALKSEVEAFKGGELTALENGDVTIKMPEESYLLFLESRKAPVIEVLEKGFESIDFYKSYELDEDMRNIDVVVDAEIYTGTDEQNTAVSVESSAIIAYQIFVNEPFGLTIHFISDATGEEITSYKAF